MTGLGALGFAEPLILLALLALPVIWYLVRALPPQPKLVRFPPLTLLLGIEPGEPPSSRTPLWLLILRLLIAAILIVMLAGPVLNPEDNTAGGDGPLLLVLDNGWEAASGWPERIALIDRLLARAARENRKAILLPTAPPVGDFPGDALENPPLAVPADRMQRDLAGLTPVPFSPDHAMAARRLDRLKADIGDIVYVSDGIAHPGSRDLAPLLAGARIFVDPSDAGPFALLPPREDGAGFRLTLRRLASDREAVHSVRAHGADDRLLSQASARFAPGDADAEVILRLPSDVRRQVARIAAAGERGSAGATLLLDQRSGRIRVGLASAESEQAQQPLRSALYYLRRALEPTADTFEGAPQKLLDDAPQAIILADVGALATPVERGYRQWVRDGGLLIRFAGPRMAAGSDSLMPVAVRLGDRAIGGALSWETPQQIASFQPDGPFAGLEPDAAVTVSRQILAAPAVDLAERTWARLGDGTPIVTARREGDGWLVLFHSTANPDWSTLALSGLYVGMLERLLLLAKAPEALAMIGDANMSLAPQMIMDGAGQLAPPPAGLPVVAASDFGKMTAGPRHPPGLYGSAGAPLALNLINDAGPIDEDFRFRKADWQGETITGGARAERDLAPPLLALLLLLALGDFLISLSMRGLALLPWRRRGVSALLALLILLASVSGQQATAQTPEERFAAEALSETRFGYILTGDRQRDELSRAGLIGLGRVLSLRTAVTLGEPMGLDPARDQLALFPFLYFPAPADGRPPSDAALLNISAYLKSGGIILFDTGVGEGGGGLPLDNPAAREALQRLIGRLDLPPLLPVDNTHVLTRSFYLLDGFPGRLSGRTLWATDDSFGDEPAVSPILIGGNDWASAWAIDANDHFLVPDIDGGMRQRELAFRAGINMAVYALTGTYKADQLHLPALLQRLGE